MSAAKHTPGAFVGYWWECGRTKCREFATEAERMEFAVRLKARGLIVTCDGAAIAKAEVQS